MLQFPSPQPLAATWWHPPLAALLFLTRLPLPLPATLTITWTSAMMVWFPLVGAGIGLGGGVVFAIGLWLGLPCPLAATVTLAAMLLLTGGLHEDGLADLADGLGGGGTRERKLEIMRDSRIGSYGALALIIALLTRYQSLTALADPLRVTAVLVVSGAVSRAAMVVLAGWLPPARSDGLGRSHGQASGTVVLAAVAFASVIGEVILGSTMVVPALVCTLAVLILGLIARCHLGGQTGDVLGAGQQIGEVVFMLAAVAKI
ncbi:Adenosylcobinamide-GDP ribazoletransferase [uncultured Gammaproteobacteria bacterium]